LFGGISCTPFCFGGGASNESGDQSTTSFPGLFPFEIKRDGKISKGKALGMRLTLRVRFFKKIQNWILKTRVDSSVPLTHHDPKDLGLICLVKKRKIRFRILPDLRIQSWIFLKKRLLNTPAT